MASLHELVRMADEWLRIDEIPDYPPALNGLQLEAACEVARIAAAVDACLPVVEQACDRGADLLVVHHGLFWSGARRIEGPLFHKLRCAIEGGLAIYSAHIPLDVHPDLGNNARLLAELDFENEAEPFFPWKGIDLGLRVEVDVGRDELLERVRTATGVEPHLCPGGAERVKSLGVITGGAGAEIAAVAETGVDTFLTGEGPHWSYTAAEEIGVNLIYAGHYATETFGVKALARRWVEACPGLGWEFIDHPTGL